MKIHFACGRHVLDGYYNVDAVAHPNASRPPDLLWEAKFEDGNLVQRLPLEDECAEELFAAHIVEHFHRYEVDSMVAEWKRLLKTGGKLILELPNLEAACRNFLAGKKDQMSMWPLYGDPSWKSPYMIHRWGYSPQMISTLLDDHGFIKIKILPPQTHSRKVDRDMRVEAIKP